MAAKYGLDDDVRLAITPAPKPAGEPFSSLPGGDGDFLALSDRMVVHIFSFCDGASVLNMASVCKRVNRVFAAGWHNDSEFWKLALHDRFALSWDQLKAADVDWLLLFRDKLHLESVRRDLERSGRDYWFARLDRDRCVGCVAEPLVVADLVGSSLLLTLAPLLCLACVALHANGLAPLWSAFGVAYAALGFLSLHGALLLCLRVQHRRDAQLRDRIEPAAAAAVSAGPTGGHLLAPLLAAGDDDESRGYWWRFSLRLWCCNDVLDPPRYDAHYHVNTFDRPAVCLALLLLCATAALAMLHARLATGRGPPFAAVFAPMLATCPLPSRVLAWKYSSRYFSIRHEVMGGGAAAAASLLVLTLRLSLSRDAGVLSPSAAAGWLPAVVVLLPLLLFGVAALRAARREDCLSRGHVLLFAAAVATTVLLQWWDSGNSSSDGSSDGRRLALALAPLALALLVASAVVAGGACASGWRVPVGVPGRRRCAACRPDPLLEHDLQLHAASVRARMQRRLEEGRQRRLRARESREAQQRAQRQRQQRQQQRQQQPAMTLVRATQPAPSGNKVAPAPS